MADRNGLKLVGFVFATLTLSVLLTTVVVVSSYADGRYLDQELSATILTR